jgi:hypothetical protein
MNKQKMIPIPLDVMFASKTAKAIFPLEAFRQSSNAVIISDRNIHPPTMGLNPITYGVINVGQMTFAKGYIA